MAEESRYLMEADGGGPSMMDPFVVGADRIRGVGLLDLIGSSAFGAPSLGSTLGVGPNSLTSLTGGANYGTGGPNIRIGGREVIGRSDIEGSNTTMVRDPFTGEVTPLPSGVIDLGTIPTGLTQGSADISDKIQQAIATRERVLGRPLTPDEAKVYAGQVFDILTTPNRNIDLSPTYPTPGQGGISVIPLPVNPGVAAGLTIAGAILGGGFGGAGGGATPPPATSTTGPETTPSGTPTTPSGPPETTLPPVVIPTGGGGPGTTTPPPAVVTPPEPTTPSTVIIPVPPPGTIGQPTTPTPVAPPTPVTPPTTPPPTPTSPTPTSPPATSQPNGGDSTRGPTGPLVVPVSPPTTPPASQPPPSGNISLTFPVATPITVRDPGLNREILREGRISTPAMREIAGGTLSSYGMLGGQPGMADIQSFQNLLGQVGAYNPELTRIASEQTIAANRAQREANIADVQRLSQAAMEAQRAANPELYSTLGTYLPAATGMLATDLERLQGAGRLSAEDVRMAQQSAREASLARGREMDMSGMAAEVLNRDALARQRQNEARANVQQSMQNVYGGIGAAQAATFNPFAALLGQQYGMQTSNVGLNQALFGQGTGFSSGALSNQFVQGLLNPYSSYAADVYGSNFNAANARAIAEANANAAAQGANLQLIGGLAGTTLNYAIPSFLDIFKSPTPAKTNPIT
jgi:hypothetical protein